MLIDRFLRDFIYSEENVLLSSKCFYKMINLRNVFYLKVLSLEKRGGEENDGKHGIVTIRQFSI